MIESLQKMALKDQSVSSPISKLPDEVFVQVLSHFSVFELARLEQVSRSWKKIIRSHQILWRDDGFEKRSQNVCPPKHMKKFRIMLQRGGGKLNRIFLPICLATNRNAKVKKLLKALICTEVQELWIVVRGTFATSKGYNTVTSAEQSTENLKKIVKTVLESMVQCGNLSSLRLVCTECIDVDMSKFGDPAKWPFSSCRLNKLVLYNIRYTSLFPKKELYKVVSNAQEMDVCFEVPNSYFQDVDVWPLIQAAKDALIKCRTSYTQGVEEVNTTSSHIFFPKLEVLYLAIQDGRATLGNGYPTFTRYMLNCPKLKELHALGTVPLPMLVHLLDNKIEKLGLCCFPERVDSMRKALISKLKNCTKVRSLIITNLSVKILKELQSSKVFQKMPLEDITCLHFDQEKLCFMKNVVQDRISSKGTLSTIKKAHFITLSGQPSEVEWFTKNIKEVKCSDMRAMFSFMYLKMKDLCNFEAAVARVPDLSDLEN